MLHRGKPLYILIRLGKNVGRKRGPHCLIQFIIITAFDMIPGKDDLGA